MIVKYTLNISKHLNTVEGEQAEQLLKIAEQQLYVEGGHYFDPELLLAETGVCEFSVFGQKFSIKVIDTE